MLPRRTEISLPLLAELHRRGGEAHPTDEDINGHTVYEALARYFMLADADLSARIGETGRNFRSKWENRVRWARNSLKDRGFLLAKSRGLWTISSSGLNFLQRQRATLKSPYHQDKTKIKKDRQIILSAPFPENTNLEKNSSVMKLMGSTVWLEMNRTESATVSEAIFDGHNTLQLECEYERRRYSLKLQRKSGQNFVGQCHMRSGRNEWDVVVNCRFVVIGDDALLFGTWKEEGVGYHWWAELERVERFDREA